MTEDQIFLLAMSVIQRFHWKIHRWSINHSRRHGKYFFHPIIDATHCGFSSLMQIQILIYGFPGKIVVKDCFLVSHAELWTWTQDTYHLRLTVHCMLYKVPSNYKRIRLLPVEFITKYLKEVFDPWNRGNLNLRLQISGPLQDYFL